MYKLECNPLTLSGLYKSGWRLYKASLVPIFFWSFIIALIHIIPYHFGFIGFYYRDMAGHLDYSWWGLFLFAALLIVEAFFVAVLFYTMYLLGTEQKIDQAVSIKNATQVFPNMYLGLIIYFFAVNIGMLLFLLPAVLIAVLFSMFMPYIVLEKQNAYQAFDSSARLVWKHWWQTFFVLVIPYAIVWMVRNFMRFTPWAGEWVHLLDAVLIAFVMPYFYSVMLVQYNNLKIIRSLPEAISQRPRSDTTPS